MLERVRRDELTHAEAATEFGLNRDIWMGWVAYRAKKAGAWAGTAAASEVAHGRKINSAEIVRVWSDEKRSSSSVPAADVAKLVARVEELERFGRELRERIRDLVAYVEEREPR
jgi:hypothetical protein